MDNVDWEDDLDIQSVTLSALTPDDFFFSIRQDKSFGVYMIMSPKKFFLLNKAQFDQHLGDTVEKLLPAGWNEVTESTFQYDGPPKTIAQLEQAMLTLGFKKDKDFSRL